MPDFSPYQLETLRRLLDARETSCSPKFAPPTTRRRGAPRTGPEVGDAVDSGEERFRAGMAHVDKQRDQEELMAIEAARARIAAGRYGECADCGKAIPFERLKAQPAAMRWSPARRLRDEPSVGADVHGLRRLARAELREESRPCLGGDRRGLSRR